MYSIVIFMARTESSATTYKQSELQSAICHVTLRVLIDQRKISSIIPPKGFSIVAWQTLTPKIPFYTTFTVTWNSILKKLKWYFENIIARRALFGDARRSHKKPSDLAMFISFVYIHYIFCGRFERALDIVVAATDRPHPRLFILFRFYRYTFDLAYSDWFVFFIIHRSVGTF